MPAKNTPCGPLISGSGILTSGSLHSFDKAWVYVAVRRSDGLVKVGMSAEVAVRCKNLKADEFFSLPVVPGAAREVETMALRRLGRQKSGAEWTFCKPETAKRAVIEAYAELAVTCHVDPSETPIQAFRRRKAIAA